MIIGFIAVKRNSNRFPNKNIHHIDGKPMFWYSVQTLLNSKVDKVYVSTDSDYVKEYCKNRNISVIWRHSNASRMEDKLLTIVRYMYYSIMEEPRIVVNLIANCVNFKSEDVDKAIEILEKNKLRDVKSFDRNGVENGLIVYDKSVMESNYDLSYYNGCIICDGKEIHYKEDLDDYLSG